MSAREVVAKVAAASQGRARIVAAVKGRDDEAVGSLLAAGITDLGENRLQEHRRREGAFAGARWHFIGRLQTNKAKGVARGFSLIHSLWRVEEAAALQAAGPPHPAALVQVNFGDPAKSGVPPAGVGPLLAAVAATAPGLTIQGLMTMPPLAASAEESRGWFRELRLLAARHFPDPVLSMGTSQDWRVAVEEGASLVRLGRSLFS